MRIVKISDGLYVNPDHIESIKPFDDGKAVITMASGQVYMHQSSVSALICTLKSAGCTIFEPPAPPTFDFEIVEDNFGGIVEADNT